MNKLLPILLLTLAATATLSAQDRMLIVVDPGHGGTENGVATGELVEKHLVLRTGFHLADILFARGFDVRLTRSGDETVSIPARRALADSVGAVLYISLHMNGDEDTSKYGVEIYTDLDSEESRTASESIAASLRGMNTPAVVEGRPWGFLKSSDYPVVMIEAGFLTNPIEQRVLVTSDYQRAMARRIANGAISYLRGRD